MTATGIGGEGADGSTSQPPVGLPLRWRQREIVTSVAVATVHDLDERFAEFAVGADRAGALWRAAVFVGFAALVILATRALRPAIATALLAMMGAVAAGDGGTHIVHFASGNGSRLDVTGVPAAGAGAVLIILAVAGAFRRAAPARARTWRWADRAATLAGLVLLTTYLWGPVALGTVQVHLPRRALSSPSSADFAAVTLSASDGTDLQAWYRPSRNGAAVMVLNSARGDHGGSEAHARLLAAHGYGVLLYDARGTGGSEGMPNGWGWTWLPDVDAGVDYLAGRPDVKNDRVGLIGLSTGADVAIRAAAVDSRIQVVVADGATAQSFADRPTGWSSAMSLWPMFVAAELLSGQSPPSPLDDAIAAIQHRPVLLVASGSIPAEISLNERYDRAGGGEVELWKLPDTEHVSGLSSQPQEYAARVLGHLDEVLLAGR